LRALRVEGAITILAAGVLSAVRQRIIAVTQLPTMHKQLLENKQSVFLLDRVIRGSH
jgi:hypothetical protein